MTKRLALIGLAVIAAVGIATTAYAQRRCGSSLCIGGASTPLAVEGAISVAGTSTLTGAVTIASTASKTTCTLNGASPAVCTATVTAGTKCFCSLVGATAAIAAMNCAVSLSGTTLTVTAANSADAVVNVICL